MKQVTANGLTFLAASAGGGPKVLFLTGSGADLRHLKTPLTSPLVNEFEVLTFDQRGMGQSAKPDGPYTMLDYAKDALGILDAYGWGRVMVVGYSFGGMVAQELALHWPERVSRLVLSATTAGGAGGSSYPIQTLDPLPQPERATRSLEVADLSFTANWRASNPDKAKDRIAKKRAAQERLATQPGAAKGRANQLAARAGHDAFDRLHQIDIPTLVIAGRRDGQAPIAAQKNLAQAISNCRFLEVDGGHGMLWANDAVFHHIADFLRTETS